MPATTRPRTTRPRSSGPPARPRTARRNPPVVGLTLETELGFMDLVAVKRALAGDDRVRLTEAERAWISYPDREHVREAGYALGADPDRLGRALDRHARRLERADAKRRAALGCPF